MNDSPSLLRACLDVSFELTEWTKKLTLFPVGPGNRPSSSPHCPIDHLDSTHQLILQVFIEWELTLFWAILAVPLPIPGLTPLLPALPTAGLVVLAAGGLLAGATTLLPAVVVDPALAPRLEGPAAELAVLRVEAAKDDVGRLKVVAEPSVALAFLVVGTNPGGFRVVVD